MFLKYSLLFTVVCPNNRGFCGSSIALSMQGYSSYFYLSTSPE